MTEHDLSTLVRDHASSDEPPFAGPERAIAGGRRAVRHRRLAAGAGVAAVLAVAGAVVVPQLGGPDTDGDSQGYDPAIQRALDDYDAEAMPEIIEDSAREVLARSVPDLGPGEFSAASDDGVVLGAGHYGEAGGMSVTFGNSEHRWAVSVIHSGADGEGDHQQTCDEDLRSGTFLACTVDDLGDGVVVVDRVTAWQKAGPQWGWGTVAPDELDRYPSDILWFEREAKVIKEGTFITYTSERVKAPTLAAAEQEFQVPVEDLAALGTDPQLVIPRPDDYGDDTGVSIPARMPSPPPSR